MKVVAIIDKPRSCKECPFKDTPIRFCLGEYEKEKRCPLKPMPSRMKVDYDTISSAEVTEKVVAIGFNACIETILGEENER